MSFATWEPVPPTTELSDLFTTSLLVLTDKNGPGILLRCSAGLEAGSAVIVHASTSRPSSLHMTGVDDNTQIGEQAQALVPARVVQVVAIPHITWGHPDPQGRRWRTPVVALGVLVSAVAIALVHPPLTVIPAIPGAALVGLLLWLLLRRKVPTGIAPDGDLQLDVKDVLRHVLSRTTTGEVARSSRVRPVDMGFAVRIPVDLH